MTMLAESSFQDNAALLYHLLQKDPLNVDLPAYGVLITDEAYCDTIRAHLLQQVGVHQIDLSGSRLASHGLRCLTETLESSCAQQLTSLRLRDTRLPAFEVPAFLRLLRIHAPRLAELDLGGNQLGDEVARDVAAYVHFGLTSLSIADNQLSDAGIYVIIKALQEKKVSSLQSLNISGNRLGLRSCTALGQYLASDVGGRRTLQELCVRHTGLNDSTAQPLAEGVHLSSLVFLDAAENDCSVTFSSFPDDAAVSAPPTLQTIDLSNNKMIAALLPGFCANLQPCADKLVDLFLSGCFNGDAQLERLESELGALPQLRRLSLADASLSYRSGLTLSRLLSRFPKLERLDVSGNMFEREGATHLARALGQLSQLHALALSSCRLGTAGASVVLTALVVSACPLEELDLSFNRIDDEGMYDLCKQLSAPESPKLRLLLLSGNACTIHTHSYLEDMLNTHQTECTVVARDTDLEAIGEATENRNASRSNSMQASLTVDVRSD